MISIQSFIDIFQNFINFPNRVEDIIGLEEKKELELDVGLNSYFKDLRALIKLIKDKIMINEKLWKISMDLINEIYDKLTPKDKVKNL